jgi:hypothetical protein
VVRSGPAAIATRSSTGVSDPLGIHAPAALACPEKPASAAASESPAHARLPTMISAFRKAHAPRERRESPPKPLGRPAPGRECERSLPRTALPKVAQKRNGSATRQRKRCVDPSLRYVSERARWISEG